jgi:BON domain
VQEAARFEEIDDSRKIISRWTKTSAGLIHSRNGVVYLEGAVPSEPQHEILLNILTDIAGVQEIVDNLEVQRLAWERDDRAKNEPKEVQPGTIPDPEPYSGTEDINLTNEEGVTYEPPENPPPHRKD